MRTHLALQKDKHVLTSHVSQERQLQFCESGNIAISDQIYRYTLSGITFFWLQRLPLCHFVSRLFQSPLPSRVTYFWNNPRWSLLVFCIPALLLKNAQSTNWCRQIIYLSPKSIESWTFPILLGISHIAIREFLAQKWTSQKPK